LAAGGQIGWRISDFKMSNPMSLIHMGVIGVLTVKVVMIDISVHSSDIFEQAQVDKQQNNHHSHNQLDRS